MFWSPQMSADGREVGHVRPWALAIVAVFGIGLALLMTRPHGSRVAAPKPKPPHDSVLSSYAPAAKVAVEAVPAAPKPTAAPAVSVVAAAPQPAPAAAPQAMSEAAVTAARPAATAEPAEPAAANVATDDGEVPDGSPRGVADTSAPPPEPLVISDANVDAVSASGAQITFRTNLPARAVASYGIDGPTVWTSPEASDTQVHQVTLSGLSFSTTYQVWVHALDQYSQTQSAVLTLTTQPMGSTTIATTSGDRILVDGEPFFPLAVWAQCSDGYAGNVADGINLFMGDGCGKDRQLPARLAGRAFSVVDADDADATGRGVIGWYFPDEWDAFLESDVTRDELRNQIPDAQPGKISFLTLTNHFYSHAAPLPQGKGMYPLLYSLADVVGFDLYPLQVWCLPAFGDVFDAQHELSDATGGKPTFQWIEVARMEQPCRNNPTNDPTPATVRAEAWLAVAGGADGIGYFPNRWKSDIGAEIARTNRQIQALSPALLAPQAPATSNMAAVKVSARALNGALYVIAVNTGYDTVQAKISVNGIAGRSATVLGDGAVVGADDTGFTDTFGPLAAKVYVIPPQGW
jgi:hypothetical protein